MKRWHQLSAKEQIDFTMNNSIKKIDNFIDDRRQTDEALYWSKKDIDNFINRIHRKESLYYGETNAFLYECLAKYPIKDKTVAILGSIKPWYEAVCLAYGGHPVTIEYNKLKTDDDRLKLMTVKEYNKNPIKFDMVMSISSIEHDGLGRYGDPIDPTGDFKAMENVRNNILKKEGLFFLAVPTGEDTLCWNAHRIYGEKRWPKLIEGFEVIYAAGFSNSSLKFEDSGMGRHQPVVVLRKKTKEKRSKERNLKEGQKQ